jgi:ATP-dependent protease ClpP protease subunit
MIPSTALSDDEPDSRTITIIGPVLDVLALPELPSSELPLPGEPLKIVLEKDNFFALTSEINSTMEQDFTKAMLTYDKDLMYIYIDSPGGGIFSMIHMINMIDSVNFKTVCVARYAASAAFLIMQHCTERYIVNNGILMSHNGSGFFMGEFPRIESELKMALETIDNIEEKTADRMKMTLDEYRKKINVNLWMSVKSAQENNAVDGIATVTCSKELVQEEIDKLVKVQLLFFEIDTVKKFYACPLMPYEIVDVDKLKREDQRDEELKDQEIKDKKKK